MFMQWAMMRRIRAGCFIVIGLSVWALPFSLKPASMKTMAAEGSLDSDLDLERLETPVITPAPPPVLPPVLEIAPAEDVPEERFVEDVPEEILRTEIITGARSPLTGEPVSAVEYAQLQAALAKPAGGNLVSPDLEYLIFLLQLRRAVKPIIPFIP